MKIKVLNIVDKIFLVFILFLLSFVWIRFFIKNILSSALISFVLAFLVEELLSFIQRKRKNIKIASKQTKQKIENIFLNFLFLSQKEISNYFQTILSKSKSVKQQNFFIISENQTGVFPFFENQTLSLEHISKIYQKAKNENISKLIIFCYECDQQTKEIISNLTFPSTTIMEHEEIFFSFLENENTPTIIKPQKQNTKKTALKQVVKMSLSKERTKSYLFSSITLILCSLFVKYNVYYLITSTLLLFLSIFSFFNRKFNTKINKDIFS